MYSCRRSKFLSDRKKPLLGLGIRDCNGIRLSDPLIVRLPVLAVVDTEAAKSINGRMQKPVREVS